MDRRLKLNQLLRDILGSDNVYYQPPMSISIKHPCIIYSLKRIDSKYADDTSYHSRKGYDIIVIDRDPDSAIPDRIGALPYVSFDRCYVSDNLNHSVFTLYY